MQIYSQEREGRSTHTALGLVSETRRMVIVFIKLLLFSYTFHVPLLPAETPGGPCPLQSRMTKTSTPEGPVSLVVMAAIGQGSPLKHASELPHFRDSSLPPLHHLFPWVPSTVMTSYLSHPLHLL